MATITHHNLTVTQINDENGPAILLEQQEDGYSKPNTIAVHPWQLRAVCEHLCLIAADRQAAKVIETLQRRMLILRDRIDDLGHNLSILQSHGHEDLTEELALVRSLDDLANEWCREFEATPPGAVAAMQSSQATTGRVDPGATPGAVQQEHA